ncbi:MAG: hypothetical protein ACRBEQ_07880 [Hyphomonas sp.]
MTRLDSGDRGWGIPYDKLCEALECVSILSLRTPGDNREPQPGRSVISLRPELQRDDGTLAIATLKDREADGRKTLSEFALHAPLPEAESNFPRIASDFSNLEAFCTAVDFFVFDDASADSVLATLCIILRLAGYPVHENSKIEAYVKAARFWKFTGEAQAQSKNSWTTLHAAGTHAIFVGGQQDVAIEAQAKAWLLALRFLTELLRHDRMPTDVPSQAICREHTLFLAALTREETIYTSVLQNAEKLQLRFPMKDIEHRYKTVDVLVFEDSEVTGALRSFYRSDLKHSHLAQGFNVALTYRPDAAPGFRYAASCSQMAGVSLEPAWRELEAKETQKWGETDFSRPNDKPRDTSMGEYNEPWFNAFGAFDLIGEPRALSNANLPGSLQNGSLLDWEDVQSCLWRAGLPARHLEVELVSATEGLFKATLGTDSTSLEAVREAREVLSADTKSFVALAWADKDSRDAELICLPTMKRYFARLVCPEPGAPGKLCCDLEPEDNFSFIEVGGGVIIVSDHGVVVLDDWRSESIRTDLLEMVFSIRKTQHTDLNRIQESLDTLQVSFLKLTQEDTSSTRSSSTLSELHNKALDLQIQLREIESRAKTLVPALEYSTALRLSTELANIWGLRQRMSGYVERVASILEDSRRLRELKIAEGQNLITKLGFAFTAAAIMSEPIGKLAHTFQEELLPWELKCGSAVCEWVSQQSAHLFQIGAALVLTLVIYQSIKLYLWMIQSE